MEIKHRRFTNNVLYACDAANMKDAVERAVREKANLDGADLGGVDLYGADLYGADLYGANLRGASLYGANLRGASLSGANLIGADLYGANLYGADLYGASLSGASLSGASLSGANLSGANIDGEIVKINPLSIAGLHWQVLITDGFMRIGCKRFSHAEWAAFDDFAIAAMDGEAAAFWADQKIALLALCSSHANRAARS